MQTDLNHRLFCHTGLGIIINVQIEIMEKCISLKVCRKKNHHWFNFYLQLIRSFSFSVIHQNLPKLGVSRIKKPTTLETMLYLFWLGSLPRLVTDRDSIFCCCLIQLVLFHYLSKDLFIISCYSLSR